MATESTSKFCEGHSEKVDMPDKQSRPMDITRTWAPKDGCLGYFAHDRYGLLPLVCLATATTGRIEKMGDETCIQLRGYVEWDVNEAMKRLDGLTSIMNLTDVPYLATMVLAPQNDSLGYSVENYAAVDWLVSSPRVLLDEATPIGEVLGMQVPVAYHHNAETRKWELAEKLRNSSCLKNAVADDPETTRAWVDFRFPATGSSNASSEVPTIIYPSQGLNAEAGSKEHPYLRSSKADELIKWVQDATSSSGGERTGSSSSALLSIDRSVPNSNSSTKEAALPHRPGRRKTPMTRVMYAARQTSAFAARSSRSAPVSRPSFSAPTRPGPPSITTLPVKPPAKFVAEAIATTSLPRQANTPETPAVEVMNKPTPKIIFAATSSLRPTAPVFIPATKLGNHSESLRGKKQSLSSLHASSTLRPTAPVFIPVEQRENQSEPFPSSPSLRKPGFLTMPLMDLPIIEETEDIPVKVASTACVKTICPVPGHEILIDFGSPAHSPPATIQQEAIEDDDLLADTFSPIKTVKVDEDLLDTSSLGRPADEELILNGRDNLDIESFLPALAAEERSYRILSAPDDCSWLMDLPGTFDRLKPKEREVELPETPVLHRTMYQTSAPDTVKKAFTQPKAVIETKSNAVVSKTLEEVPKRQHSSSESCVPGPSQSQAIFKTSQIKQTLTGAQTEQTKYLFKTIEPLLNAATWYPGSLSLDISFGLLLLYSSPDPAKKKFMSLDDLKDHLKHDPASPSCRFFDQLTTSPVDVDHIINLEVDYCRLFDEKPEERTFKYEVHCQLGAEHFLVVIDQSHKISFRQLPVRIGSVLLNIPGSIWDASLAIHGAVRQLTADIKEIKEAADDIVRNMFIEPDRTHVRLVLNTAKGLNITKVILQRATFHRHIRPNGPYMYLCVKETQDLIITAHCAPRKEMVKANRQWWSLSLNSPILDATMQRDSEVKLGETTTWKPKCLFGDDAECLRGSESSETLPKSPFVSAGLAKLKESTLSSSIGCSGLSSLVRLAETVVKNINFVGANNANPAMNIDKWINRDDDGLDAKGELTSPKIVVQHRGFEDGKKTVFW